MNHSTLGLPVHHHLPEFTQTDVHRVCDAIQPSHPLLSPSPPALNPSQHQSLFSESTLRMRWPKYWSFSFSIIPSKEYPGLVSFRMDRILSFNISKLLIIPHLKDAIHEKQWTSPFLSSTFLLNFKFLRKHLWIYPYYLHTNQPVHPKGDQSWVFIRRNDAKTETPVLWPPHAKS